MIEFFDYQCVYCSRLAPVMEQVIKAHPQTRFAFKEWPIFGGRWESSLEAAKPACRSINRKGRMPIWPTITGFTLPAITKAS